MTDEFQDHGVTLEGATRIAIRKDDFIPSRPWHADVEWSDGSVWKGWQEFYRTRKALIEDAKEALSIAGMTDDEIEGFFS